MNQFVEGFLLQASLILALGAQNIFVLESGLKKQRHFLVAALCSVCDLLLIAVGVMGAASIFVRVPILKILFGVIGVLFLIYYGIKKLREGISPTSIEVTHEETATSFKKVVLLSLGFSLLNPHVYLDTVILIGGYSAKYTDLIDRIVFGAGAGGFSVLWFFGLALFASAMSSFFFNPKAMRIISLISGLILLMLSWKLGSDVYSWFG